MILDSGILKTGFRDDYAVQLFYPGMAGLGADQPGQLYHPAAGWKVFKTARLCAKKRTSRSSSTACWEEVGGSHLDGNGVTGGCILPRDDVIDGVKNVVQSFHLTSLPFIPCF